MLFTEKLRPRVDSLQLPLLKEKNVEADVLRLDLVDGVISGNKWFKLKEYVAEALAKNKRTIITFGGAFSNHILATAAFCSKIEIKSIGIIRGEQPKDLSGTLQNAVKWGMELFFVSRDEYKQTKIPEAVLAKYPNAYIINEGGYGALGMEGSKTILDLLDTNDYTHILSAVGTGTTLAGLIENSKPYQQIIGMSSLKNNFELENEINALLSSPNKNKFHLVHDFHFGGYAKYNNSLIDFMNDWYATTDIPSDFVYTGKTFYGFDALIKKDFFPGGAKILLVHTGGLQGNNSLKKGTLIF